MNMEIYYSDQQGELGDVRNLQDNSINRCLRDFQFDVKSEDIEEGDGDVEGRLRQYSQEQFLEGERERGKTFFKAWFLFHNRDDKDNKEGNSSSIQTASSSHSERNVQQNYKQRSRKPINYAEESQEYLPKAEAKQKFRVMKFRRRRNTGPQSDVYRKPQRNGEKAEQEMNEIIKARMRSIFPKIEDTSGIFAPKKIEDAFDRYIQQEVSIHSYDEDRETDLKFKKEESREKIQVEPLEKKNIKITKENIQALFEHSSLCLAKAEYTSEPDQDPFFQLIFNQLKEDLQYKSSNEKSCHSLSKGKLFMVRKVMEAFCGIPQRQNSSFRFVRQRLTIKEQKLFEKKDIPIPPCRLTAPFLQKLFEKHKKQDFPGFFKNFVDTGRLLKLLRERSKRQIIGFKIFYQQCAALQEETDKKIEHFKADFFAPLSHLQIDIFMGEANAICSKYG